MSAPRVWARRLLTIALVAAAVAFIARIVVVNSRDLATFDWQIRVWVLALSVAAHVFVLCTGVYIWSRVLHFFASRDTPFPALLRVWALSNVARYIPGGIWRLLAAARLASSTGMSQVVTLSAMVVHVLLSLVSACVTAAFTLPLAALGVPDRLALVLRVGVVIGALVCVHPAWINLGLRLVPRALHRDVLAWHARWIDGLGLLCLSIVSWLLFGGAFYLFLLSLAPIPLSALPASAGVNALSFAAGAVMVVAPAGLGVKELAMTGLLAPLLPAGVAAVIAVASRLWAIAAELALAGIALLARDGRAPDAGAGPAAE